MKNKGAVVGFWLAVATVASLLWASHWKGLAGVLNWIGGQEGAAWAQAIGSVLAVWTAVAIASRQASEAEKREQAAIADRYRAFGAAIGQFTVTANNLLVSVKHVHADESDLWRRRLETDLEIARARRWLEESHAVVRGFVPAGAMTAHLGAMQVGGRAMAFEFMDRLEDLFARPSAEPFQDLWRRMEALFLYLDSIEKAAAYQSERSQ
jgi:hypothetical protein